MKNHLVITVIAAVTFCVIVYSLIAWNNNDSENLTDGPDHATESVERVSLPHDSSAADSSIEMDDPTFEFNDQNGMGRNNRKTQSRNPEVASSHQGAQKVASASVAKREEWVLSIVRKTNNKPFTSDQVERIVGSLEDKAPSVRATAVTILGRSKSPDAIVPLVDALMDSNVRVRQRAQASLRKLIGIDFPYDASNSAQERSRIVKMIRNKYVPMAQADLEARLAASK